MFLLSLNLHHSKGDKYLEINRPTCNTMLGGGRNNAEKYQDILGKVFGTVSLL